MDKITVLGIPIDCVTWKSIDSAVLRLLEEKKQVFIATPNPEHIILAQKQHNYFTVLQHTDLNVPDGIGLVWAAKRILAKQGVFRPIERVTGIDLMLYLCKTYGAHMKVGLLGGLDGVASKAADRLRKLIPNVDIIALPYYEYGKADTEIVQKIQDEKVEILFVALGAPKQELFISKYLNKMPHVRLAIGVGGAFDVYAGNLSRPPLWLQKLNLEWLYRLIQEPSRWKRQLKLVEFVWRILRTKN